MPEGTETPEVKAILAEVFKEAIKDILVRRPFARGKRLDDVSASILGTVGMTLTLYVGISSWILQRTATHFIKFFILLPSVVLILSVLSLVLSVRSREVMVPSEMSLETYMDFLKELSGVNNEKKRLQDLGLILFIFGIMLMATSLVLWIF